MARHLYAYVVCFAVCCTYVSDRCELCVSVGMFLHIWVSEHEKGDTGLLCIVVYILPIAARSQCMNAKEEMKILLYLIKV